MSESSVNANDMVIYVRLRGVIGDLNLDAALEAFLLRNQFSEVFLIQSIEYKDRIRAFLLRVHISLLGFGRQLGRSNELMALSGQVEHGKVDEEDSFCPLNQEAEIVTGRIITLTADLTLS